MSLLSLVRDPLDLFRPSLMLDADEDFLTPRRLRRMLLAAPYTRNWRSQASENDKGSTISLSNNQFQVSLDVQQFAPEEITVKASGNTISVEGKHEEKQDEHGTISRHFVRRYTVPEGHDMGLVRSKLSSDGVLTITAPRNQEKGEEREIPIALTGAPTPAAMEVEGAEDKKKEKREERIRKKK